MKYIVPKHNPDDTYHRNIGHLPEIKDIPIEFFRGRNAYRVIAKQWFYSGIYSLSSMGLYPKDEVISRDAQAAIQTIMSNLEIDPKHKIAASAYLLSEWFHLRRKGKS